ncbi:MAG: tRNA (adenosine(37)-N6)-threonylcarbamoyltransferase complex dimerization subunit type 1 TsaB [Erysipelotrichaceae bacterium]|nr:tRNA (adenosine(37)-N6)-threonylcarbamoyltransferase complex dimerization subunit type 1 TsaB [Erysipelotrichaceae bacterium]
MYALGIDTSHLFLLIVLMNEDGVVDAVQLDCFKQQSEYIISQMDELLKRNSLTIGQVDDIVVTRGPGSYTGVRIGMTVAKVLGSITGKNVYTLSTLQLYAGRSDCRVLIDARAKRVYSGRYRDGKVLEPESILFNQEAETLLEKENCEFFGDLHLFGRQDRYEHLADNFFALKSLWQKEEDVDRLAPVYFKSRKEYLK